MEREAKRAVDGRMRKKKEEKKVGDGCMNE